MKEIAAIPVRPWNSRPTWVSLRTGVLPSIMVSATTRRGLSSFSDTTSPTRMPAKFTLPPLRRPEAEPSKITRNGDLLVDAGEFLVGEERAERPGDQRQGQRPDHQIAGARHLRRSLRSGRRDSGFAAAESPQSWRFERSRIPDSRKETRLGTAGLGFRDATNTPVSTSAKPMKWKAAGARRERRSTSRFRTPAPRGRTARRGWRRSAARRD